MMFLRACAVILYAVVFAGISFPVSGFEREVRFGTVFPKEHKLHQSTTAVLRAAFQRLGYDFQVIVIPAVRAPMEANAGKLDGLAIRVAEFHALYQYPNLIQVQEPVITLPVVLYTNRKDLKWKGIQSLKPYMVGYQAGVAIAEHMVRKAGLPERQKVAVFQFKQAFFMLELARLDIVIANPDIAESIIKKEGIDSSGFRVIRDPIEPHKMYSYMHKKHAALAKKLSATIKQMKKDGSYARLCH